MIRHIAAMFVFLSLMALGAQAADNPPYAVTAEATRSADKITVSVKLTRKELANVPGAGQKEVTTTLASPKVVLFEGQQVRLAVQTTPAATGQARPQPKLDEMESGYRVDIISVKGRDEILMVTTLLQNSQVVWADVTTVQIANPKAGKGEIQTKEMRLLRIDARVMADAYNRSGFGVTATFDAARNTIALTGPAEKVREAIDQLKKDDATPPVPAGSEVVTRTATLKNLKAADLVPAMNEKAQAQAQGAPAIKSVAKPDSNQIQMTGTRDAVQAATAEIAKLDEAAAAKVGTVGTAPAGN